jgi:hypothetical protein
MEPNLLSLTEYSSKYKVSISTLRRKIKSNDIRFRFEHGKYLIFDESVEREAKRPSQAKVHGRYSPPPQSPSLNGVAERDYSSRSLDSEKEFLNTTSAERSEEPILTAANRLLTELKKAYTQILQEKEEQILHLREEVADLKTLVRVLESENSRKQDQFAAGFRDFNPSNQNFSEKD